MLRTPSRYPAELSHSQKNAVELAPSPAAASPPGAGAVALAAWGSADVAPMIDASELCTPAAGHPSESQRWGRRVDSPVCNRLATTMGACHTNRITGYATTELLGWAVRWARVW